jgi:hypothetical protein
MSFNGVKPCPVKGCDYIARNVRNPREALMTHLRQTFKAKKRKQRRERAHEYAFSILVKYPEGGKGNLPGSGMWSQLHQQGFTIEPF